MNSKNLIHVKLEYTEAIKAKKDILTSERDLLRIVKIIKRYHSLRLEEIKLKLKLKKKLKEVHANINKLRIILPKINMPDILKKEKEDKKIDKIEQKIKEKTLEEHDDNLELELQNIQDKLSALAR